MDVLENVGHFAVNENGTLKFLKDFDNEYIKSSEKNGMIFTIEVETENTSETTTEEPEVKEEKNVDKPSEEVAETEAVLEKVEESVEPVDEKTDEEDAMPSPLSATILHLLTAKSGAQ